MKTTPFCQFQEHLFKIVWLWQKLFTDLSRQKTRELPSDVKWSDNDKASSDLDMRPMFHFIYQIQSSSWFLIPSKPLITQLFFESLK